MKHELPFLSVARLLCLPLGLHACALLGACAAEVPSGDFADTADDEDGSSTGGPANTPGDGGEGNGDEDSDDGDGGAKFDIASNEDHPAPEPELTCESLGEHPPTSVGCSFFAVELPAGSALPYGISVGNPSSKPATVRIEDMRGPNQTLRVLTEVVLEPEDSRLIEVTGPGKLIDEDQTVAPGMNSAAAFRVVSDVPVTAMQINPVGGGPSAVAEASLLLPENALDTAYLGLGYTGQNNQSNWVVVVATQDGTTVEAGGSQTSLDAFDVRYFPAGSDATGFRVSADKPVAVFSGATCPFVPADMSFCDHLEEQLFPLASWGTRYVGARHPVRVPDFNDWGPEPVYWRLVSGTDDVEVTLDPPIEGVGDTVNLAAAGDFFEIATTENFVASSDEPFLLVQYMGGCMHVTKGVECLLLDLPTGDPYMLQMPAVDQWLRRTPFLTDTSYPRDFVVITRETGTPVELACLGPVSDEHFVAIPGSEFETGFVDLDLFGQGGEGDCVDGQQFLDADSPVGVFVGGLDFASSYGYPGGMRIQPLWDPQG